MEVEGNSACDDTTIMVPCDDANIKVPTGNGVSGDIVVVSLESFNDKGDHDVNCVEENSDGRKECEIGLERNGDEKGISTGDKGISNGDEGIAGDNDGVEEDPQVIFEEACLYCDDVSVDVKDVVSYRNHLRDIHCVSKNVDLLTSITIRTQQERGGGNGDQPELVSPEPCIIKEDFKLPENLSDIESDDDDDQMLQKQESIDEDKGDVIEVGITLTMETNGTNKDPSSHDKNDADEHKVNSNGECKVTEIKEGVLDPIEHQPLTALEEKDIDPDAIVLNVGKQDEFEPIEMEETNKEANVKDDDALSDLSLSDDEFDQNSSEWVVLDEAKSDDKDKSIVKVEDDSKFCTKCDVRHKISVRCTFLLKGSSNNTPKKESREARPVHKRPRVETRVRTLPPELYNNPDCDRRDSDRRIPSEGYEDRRGHSRRSRSPIVKRRAPTPPSEFEKERDRAAAREREKMHERRSHGESRKSESSGRSTRTCKLCSSTSHLVKNCPDLFCYKCNQQGHFAKECTSTKSGTGAPTPHSKEKSHVPTSSSTETSAYPSHTTFPGQAGYAQYFPQTSQISQSSHTVANQQYPSSSYSTYSAPPLPPTPAPPGASKQDPAVYQDALISLQPLQQYMSARMNAIPGSTYPNSYIDLLTTNVGKMLAQANLGSQQLFSSYSIQGEAYVRDLLSRELAVYAERYPHGVNLPLITETTVEFLRHQYQTYGAPPSRP